MGARGNMPRVDEVILTEDYQTGTADIDSTSSRTICDDLEVRWGMQAWVRSEMSLCWDCDIFLSNGVMTVGMG